MKSYIACLAGMLLICTSIEAHSWVACTNYAEENGAVYDPTKCTGFPRNWNLFAGSGFGIDTGYNYQGLGCGPQNVRTYSAQYPMAVYNAGQRICLAWPTKNHVAATTMPDGSSCAAPTNVYIPDYGIGLYVRPMSTDGTDPTQDQFYQNQITPFGNGVHTNGVQDYKGFQNCPNFCNNNDKSLCTGCFNVPSTMVTGNYTFEWVWQLNQGQFYTTCFDAAVVSGSNPASTTTKSSIQTSISTSTSTSKTTSNQPLTSTSTSTSTSKTSQQTSNAPQTSTSMGTPSTTSSPSGSVSCSQRWECTAVTNDYNFVDCISGQCQCLSGFSGAATANSKCACTGTIGWVNNGATCLTNGQCISDSNCAAPTCTNQNAAGVGQCNYH